LRDESGVPVPDGEVGVVTLRSPCSMRGYWNDPERTADTLSPDGWITTSDLGMLRDDGNLVLKGRTSEMYIRGGFNIHPLEVERVVADHPKVSRVAIVGAPAPTIGEIGVAFVEPVDADDPPTLDEIRAFVRERLADYKQPDRLEVVAELPMTAMLKIDKRVLQARLAQAG
jgi:acyl-CoA synthetase (AMP-forming)/AMP-acid ligase II